MVLTEANAPADGKDEIGLYFCYTDWKKADTSAQEADWWLML
jgi:hypothetical protein